MRDEYKIEELNPRKYQLLKEKMKKIEEQAKTEAESSMLYRIYASAGNPLDTGTYLFVAEFPRRKPAEKYADYIQKKKRYSDKTILIKEVAADEPAPEEGEIVLLLSPLGEFPVPKKEKDSDPHPPHGRKKKNPAKEKEKKT